MMTMCPSKMMHEPQVDAGLTTGKFANDEFVH